MVRKHAGSTNVTVRKGLVDIIEEEIVMPGFMGYTSNAEVIHDGGRLMIVIALAIKLLEGDPIKNEKLATLLSILRKKAEELM